GERSILPASMPARKCLCRSRARSRQTQQWTGKRGLSLAKCSVTPQISFAASTFLFFLIWPEALFFENVIAGTFQNSALQRLKASEIPNKRLLFLFTTGTIRRDFTAFLGPRQKN